MTCVRVACLALGVVLVAGCGSGGGSPPSKGELAKGKQVFVGKCGGCHSLKAAGTTGIVGGPLDGITLKKAFVEQRVRFGGNGMPAFNDTLSDGQITAVSDFVADASGS